MKCYVIFFLIAFSSNKIFSQQFSAQELFTLCSKKNWDDVNQTLDRKGWIYDESSKGDENTYSIITWAFNKNDFTNKATAWFHFFIDEDKTGRVELVFSNSLPYNTIKNDIIKLGAKFLSSEIENNEINTKYETARYIITLKTAKTNESVQENSSSSTFYKISIIEKESVFDSENGFKKIYDKEGNLEAEYYIKNGKLNGIAKTYYPGGKVKVISNFLNGKRIGKVREFTEDGFLDKEYSSNENILDGFYEKYYYNDNTLVLKENGKYINDKKNGLWQLVRVKGSQQKQISFENYVNGELNGPFKEITSDSLIIGNYKLGLLHGEYKVYVSISRLLFGSEMDGDTSNKTLILSGSYLNGNKSGKWKYMSLTEAVIAEGQFYNNEKDGTWKYYYDVYTDDSTNNSKKYSKELYLTENYKGGLLNGESIRYSYLNKKIIDCKTNENNIKSDIDTCYTMEYEKFIEKSTYKNDVLNGPYLVYDSLNQLKFKGNFINNMKDGLWIEGITNEGIMNYSGFYLYQTGKYLNDKREGEWQYYFPGEKKTAKMNYNNGLLNGRYEEYDTSGAISLYADLVNGHIKMVTNYDQSGSSIQSKYNILKESDSEFIYTEDNYTKDSTTSTTYLIKKNFNSTFPIRHFIIYTALATRLEKSEPEGYKHGPYKVFTSNGKPLIEGQYYKGKKSGVWKFFNTNGKIEKTEMFSD